jgi:integration host factor subunit alpha
MKKVDIARRLARESGVSKAEAADRLDRVVHRILSSLRQGRTAKLPGLGTFAPGTEGARFEREPKDGDAGGN